MFDIYGLNRTACDVLEELRTCHTSRNYAALPGLVEELQSMFNRMEAKLNDIKDVERLHDHIKDLKAEARKLKSKVKKMEDRCE